MFRLVLVAEVLQPPALESEVQLPWTGVAPVSTVRSRCTRRSRAAGPRTKEPSAGPGAICAHLSR